MNYTRTEILYKHDASVHNFNAPREIVPLIMSLVNPSSVLDVGCGIGTWLRAFQEAGVKDVVGIDGNYVDKEMLVIADEHFRPFDLREDLHLDRTFDLVISLEVAEHLPEAVADKFVASLCRHGSSIVFSAAIPGQIGQNHLNEQWPTYWKNKFEKHGFYFHDVIRPQVWENANIDLWYKQNIFLVNQEAPGSFEYVSLVHPDMLAVAGKTHREYVESLTQGRQGLNIAWRIFRNSLMFKLRTLFWSK